MQGFQINAFICRVFGKFLPLSLAQKGKVIRKLLYFLISLYTGNDATLNKCGSKLARYPRRQDRQTAGVNGPSAAAG
jgi:hypothetical protein